MAKALVTGANGFIGSHLVRELLRRGYDVNCLVRFQSDITSLRGLSVPLFIGDVREPDTLAAPLRGVEYVFHLAAELMVTGREAFEETNAGGTLNMLDAVERHAPSLKRFLFVSSQAAAGPGRDQTPLREDAEPNPISWYGASKRMAEEAVLSRAGRLPVTIVRPPSVYGERDKDISQMYPVADRRIHPVLGIRKKYLVMVYAGDLVRGMVDAAESGATLGNTYFLNHPQVLTAKDVITSAARALGKPVGLPLPVPILMLRLAAPFAELLHHFSRNRPKLTRDKAREIAQRFWVTDSSRARRDFGWEPRHDLAKGMEATIAEYLENERELRTMPLERGVLSWLKYVIVAGLVGALAESASALGRFYTFTPRWAVVLSVAGWFGIVLGTLARLLRKRGDLLQFAVGTVVMGAAELMNSFGLIPLVRWEFAPRWPFGIESLWPRSLVLGAVGGLLLVVVSAVMRVLYRRRLRFG